MSRSGGSSHLALLGDPLKSSGSWYELIFDILLQNTMQSVISRFLNIELVYLSLCMCIFNI